VRSTLMTTADMKKGLGGLATIATTAPFIGLFADGHRIIRSFAGMAATGTGGLGAVSAGIAGGALRHGGRPRRRHSGGLVLQLLPEQDRALPGRDVELRVELIDYFMKRQNAKGGVMIPGGSRSPDPREGFLDRSI